jgi:TonB family protein
MRRRAFAGCLAAAVAGHAAVAVLVGLPQAAQRKPHAHTVWLAAAASPPAAAAEPAPAPAVARADAAPQPVVEAADAGALPAGDVAGAVARTLAVPALDELRDAAAPARLAAYRLPSELTRRAQIASAVDLSFRPAATPPARGGSARLVVLVSSQGTVDEVLVERSTLPEEFQALAVASFQRVRFRPGMVAGDAVPARVTIEVSDSPPPGGA